MAAFRFTIVKDFFTLSKIDYIILCCEIKKTFLNSC